jgi:hypothetical protein
LPIGDCRFPIGKENRDYRDRGSLFPIGLVPILRFNEEGAEERAVPFAGSVNPFRELALANNLKSQI